MLVSVSVSTSAAVFAVAIIVIAVVSIVVAAVAAAIVVIAPVVVPAAAVYVCVSTTTIVVVPSVAGVVLPVLLLVFHLAHMYLLHHQHLLLDHLMSVVHGGFGCLRIPIHFVCHLRVGFIPRVDLSL